MWCLASLQLSLAAVAVRDVIGLKKTDSESIRVLEGGRIFIATSSEGRFHRASNDSLLHSETNKTTKSSSSSLVVGSMSIGANMDNWQSLAMLIVGAIALFSSYFLSRLLSSVKAGWPGGRSDEHELHQGEFESEGEDDIGTEPHATFDPVRLDKPKQHDCLLILMSCCYVAVLRFARVAEQENAAAQKTSIIRLLSWISTSSLMLLAIPYVIAHYRANGGCNSLKLIHNDATSWEQAITLYAIRLVTHWCFIAAFYSVSTSLSQTLLSASPVITLFLSVCFFQTMRRTSCVLKSVCVAMMVCGVYLVSEPWSHSGKADSSLVYGIGLSLLASFGSSLYGIRFKRAFSNRLQLGDVYVLLARIGLLSFVVEGTIFAAKLKFDAYPLDLTLVPWNAVALTAFASMMYNLCKSVCLSKRSPLIVDLASQLGVASGALLDMYTVLISVNASRASGIIISFVSFFSYTWIGHVTQVDQAVAS